MSGPKVVRIVTREEILDLCHGLLARVDAALAEWTRVGRRNDCLDEDAIVAAKRRRDALAALIEADEFMALQKEAPVEEAFLRDDLTSRLAQAAARESAARSREMREREAGATLLRTLRSSGRELPHDLAGAIEAGDAGAISRGFQLLSGQAQSPSASRELASQFREEGSRSSFADWLARQPATALDPAVERIGIRLHEIEALGATECLSELRGRLQEAVRASGARRSLLLDGLEVETGRTLTEMRRVSALTTDLRLLLAEMHASGLSTEAFDALEERTASELEAIIKAAGGALEAHRAEKAAAARRAAILEGLAGLGYEMTEGMSTSFADGGRAVLRSASRPDYGVEVSAAGGGSRLQMRPVAFTAGADGPNPARDRDAETIWCGDVAALETKLGSTGGGLVIEQSLPIGATPLKRIAVEDRTGGHTAAAPVLKERTLR